MATAKIDDNRNPTLIGVSSVDSTTPTNIAVNPSTGAMLIDSTSLYSALDTRYLKLAADNDPITGDLLIKPTSNSTTTFQIQQSDGTNVVDVDTTNRLMGINEASPGANLQITASATGTKNLILKKISSQSVNLLEIQNEAAAVRISVDSSLRLKHLFHASFGASASPIDTNVITLVETSTITSGAFSGISSTVTANPQATSSANYSGLTFAARTNSGNAQDINDLRGVTGQTVHVGTGTVTVAYGAQTALQNQVGGTISTGYGTLIRITADASTTITDAKAGYFDIDNSGTVTTGHGVFVDSIQADTTGYGIYVNNITAATTNYGLYLVGGATEAAHIETGGAAAKGLVIKGAASQSANLQEWQSSAGALLTRVTEVGERRSNFTVTDDNRIGMESLMTSNSAGFIGTSIAFKGQLTYSGAGGISNARAMDASIIFSGSSPATANGTALYCQATVNRPSSNVYGLQFAPGFNTSGVVGGLYGVYIKAPGDTQGVSLTNQYGIYMENVSVGTNSWAILTNAGNIVFNEGGDANTDIRIETDNEPNFFYLDGGSEWLRLGDWDTNYVEVDKAGDMLFVGGGGLAFAEIYANDANDTITVTTAGQANKVQITSFDTDGVSNNMTPDHTNDHVTVTKAGMYLCTVSIACASAAAGGADRFGFAVYKNNGATEFANLHSHRELGGGGGDFGSVTISGIIDLAVNDTMELWAWNEDSTDDIVIDDVTLSLVMVGGT